MIWEYSIYLQKRFHDFCNFKPANVPEGMSLGDIYMADFNKLLQ